MTKTLVILFLTGTSVFAHPTARIAISSDGNWHDRDDISASAIIVAMLGKTGNQSRLVHYNYADHYWITNANREEAMRVSTVETAKQWNGFDLGVFYNSVRARTAAVSNLVAEINKSTADNPLVIFGLGPMQVIGLAVAQSEQSRRGYVTLMSHSANFNDNHAVDNGASEGLTGTLYSYDKIGDMGVKLLHIINQNPGVAGPLSEYYWLRDSNDPKLRWLWDRGQAANRNWFDCSDAGVAYCHLTDDPTATPLKLKALLTAP